MSQLEHLGKSHKNIDAVLHALTERFNQSTSRQSANMLDFDAQILAALMLQSNAFVSIKSAVKLCSISRQEIDRRVNIGTFPKPVKLSGDEKSIRKAFRIHDIIEWLQSPREYKRPNNHS